jgi:putative FmdB family regulatory protein
MPTYHYRCTKCRFEFEEFQSITDAPLEKCPKCGARPERLISGGAGLLFKGGGFYTTDYRSEGYKKAASAEAPKSEGSPADKKSSSDKPSEGGEGRSSDLTSKGGEGKASNQTSKGGEGASSDKSSKGGKDTSSQTKSGGTSSSDS